MREIKFRAWLRGKMYYGAVQWHPAMNGEWLIPIEDGNLVTKDATIEQFTGLKDKNGKEIYEGDIVHCLTGWWDGVVTWHLEGSCGWIIEPLPEHKHSGCYGLNYNYEFEVIGNIHENKEILK